MDGFCLEVCRDGEGGRVDCGYAIPKSLLSQPVSGATQVQYTEKLLSVITTGTKAPKLS